MTEMMIREWNEIVQTDDLVYILGDIAFLPASDAVKILNRLNGRKILIEGNHDHKSLKDNAFRLCFEEIHIYHEILVDGVRVCMFHYPITEWNQCHRGSVHFFGHQHGTADEPKCRSMDVGMDATGMIVCRMDDLIARMLKKPMQGHH